MANMDIFPRNQLQALESDEQQKQDQPKRIQEYIQNPFQESLFSYHHHFQQDFHGGASSKALKAKRRRTENVLEVHGGRIVQPASRKDRHSKVCTARGNRDRRVRLSPKTAIQFYDVQDRLGYDRPSKAIDWLMNEAKAAIDALHSPPPPPMAAGKYPAETHGLLQNLKSETENDIIIDDNGGVISSFAGLFNNGPLGPDLSATELRAYPSDDFDSVTRRTQEGLFLSAPLTSSWQIFDPNLMEMSRIQMFSQREPLQSSFSRINANYSPIISAQFPGICEEPANNFTDAMGKFPVFSEP